MPYVSNAQRRWAHTPTGIKALGGKAEVHHWDEATKGKKLPERVKSASLLQAFEFTKAAEDIGDWMSQHPVATGLGVAGLGAGGVVAKRLLTKAAPAKGILKKLRPLAKKEGISVLMPATLNAKGKPTLMSKVKAHMLTGGAVRPVYTDEAYNVLKGQKGARSGRQLKGVTLGTDPHFDLSKAELETGGLATGKESKGLVRAHEKLESGGKVMEGSKAMGIQQHMAPGTSVDDIATKYKLQRPRKNASMEAKAKFLNELQGAIKKEYPKGGFFAKPHGISGQAGAFPSEAGKWGDIYRDYHARLKPEIATATQTLKKLKSTTPIEHAIRKRFSKDPSYVGYAFDPALKQMAKTRVERKLPIVKGPGGKPIEYRVHAVGGEAPADLSYHRYMNVPGARRLIKGPRIGSTDEAAKWVEQNILPNLPAKVRKGSFATDVIRVRKPGGGYGYKLIELNPTSHSSGIGSGFMDPEINPMAPYRLHKWIHGKEAPIVTGAKALGTGGLLGTGAGLSANAAKE